MTTNKATFRFYEELNDFLPPSKSKKRFSFSFKGTPSIKDSIEAIGIPHPEVDIILVNGESIGFNYLLKNGDDVAVYPVFESLDISNINKLRPKPLRENKFILDVNLGKLAKYLRMLGFDCCYDNNYSDQKIQEIGQQEKRIILTRDRNLLKHHTVTHGYWMRATMLERQLQEVIQRFDLIDSIKPLTRCLECNGSLFEVSKDKVKEKLSPKTKEIFNIFYQCSACHKIYWPGSHYDNMQRFIQTLTN